MQTNRYCFCLFVLTFFIPSFIAAQKTNFDETWREFLENNTVSKMSELVTPNKVTDQPNYAKYLLMNTNSNFCQSKVEKAEDLMSEVKGMVSDVYHSIPGFGEKMKDLDTKIKAYHKMDDLWNQFLETSEVDQDELDAVAGAKTSCEKRTLAKYSYMTAYYNFCDGDIENSRNIFENRTLRLTEKTSLRVKDVKGLASEVAKMKSLFKDLSKLDAAWNTYMRTGDSPGFDIELPLISCNPIPKMKEMVLNGALDMCKAAPEMLEKIQRLQDESGVFPEGELAEKITELEEAVEENNSKLLTLNEAWQAFLPDNKVKHVGKYGHDYCDKESLIRAYVLDGFTYVCELAEERLQKIDDLQVHETTELEDITMVKINELAELNEQYQSYAMQIEALWKKFIAQDDSLGEEFESPDFYCDNIHQIKDWTIRGLSGGCEEGQLYLEKIEAFKETFEFNFTEDLDCRVQKLRILVWDCRFELVEKLAKLEASPETYEEKLEELKKEYGMGARPEVCPYNE